MGARELGFPAWIWLFVAYGLALPVVANAGYAPLLLPGLFAWLQWRFPSGPPALAWPRNAAARTGSAFFLAGLGLELLAWSGSFLTSDPHPNLMHPQLGPDMMLAVGFYGGMALGWMTGMRWWTWSRRSAYAVVGFWGLAIEQQGAALLAIARALPTAPLPALALGLQVFVVYGAIGGIAQVFAPAGAAHRTRRDWLKYPVALIALTAGAYLGTACVAVAAGWFGGLPAPGPMRERPLW